MRDLGRSAAANGPMTTEGAGRAPGGALPCAPCLRRTWLLARLAGRLEIARHDGMRLPEVLALPGDRLIAALAGAAAPAVTAEFERFDADAARDGALAAGLTGVCRHDPRYPQRLRHASDAPAILHVLGDVDRLAVFADDQPTVAIVGTRRPSPYGVDMARALARDLARAGVPVVSGMALGVDAAAHAGTLDAGGLTVAVLAGGADVPYPASKRRLHAEIARTGLVVGELPPGFRAFRWSFPARNRVIAALSDITVVVEAAQRSGALITADLAARLGRDVAAVPGPVTSPVSAGPNDLLKDGAALVRDASDVLDALLGAGHTPPQPSSHRPGLAPPLNDLLDAIARGADPVAAIEDPGTALAGLGELEIRGLIRRMPGGRYGIVP